MGDRIIRIAMNGITGRMGRNQHLARSLIPLRDQGGVALPDGSRLIPEPVLVGRNPEKVAATAAAHDVPLWTCDVREVLDDPEVEIYFDAQSTNRRAEAVGAALEAGKAVYCEKPLAESAADARRLLARAEREGVKHGIVADKLFLPGLRGLRTLVDQGFFGRILSVRVDFGYWVNEGLDGEAQRPAWNYRAEEGGSIILDMFPHWQYVVEDLFGEIESVCALGQTHIPVRYEDGEAYPATADDAAYAIMRLREGTVVQINSSWTTRVYRDDLAMFQVDGVDGSAVAGLRECRRQDRAATPRPVWNPDVPNPIDFRAGWTAVEQPPSDNGFKLQWEAFLRYVAAGEPFPWTFAGAVRGLELVEAALLSWRERRWADLAEVRP